MRNLRLVEKNKQFYGKIKHKKWNGNGDLQNFSDVKPSSVFLFMQHAYSCLVYFLSVVIPSENFSFPWASFSTQQKREESSKDALSFRASWQIHHCSHWFGTGKSGFWNRTMICMVFSLSLPYQKRTGTWVIIYKVILGKEDP